MLIWDLRWLHKGDFVKQQKHIILVKQYLSVHWLNIKMHHPSIPAFWLPSIFLHQHFMRIYENLDVYFQINSKFSRNFIPCSSWSSACRMNLDKANKEVLRSDKINLPLLFQSVLGYSKRRLSISKVLITCFKSIFRTLLNIYEEHFWENGQRLLFSKTYTHNPRVSSNLQNEMRKIFNQFLKTILTCY